MKKKKRKNLLNKEKKYLKNFKNNGERKENSSLFLPIVFNYTS